MESRLENALGKISISSNAIANIVANATLSCPGVLGMGMKSFTEGIVNLLGREQPSKGVEVSISGDKVSIDVFIIVSYGTNIPELGDVIARNIKSDLERFTGLIVSSINVNVVGISSSKEV
ncbi:MAG: Asp23/Gls24 family envelope stress response protein [bacterium]